MANVIKRFIAGAVCPRCSEMDKLVVYRQDERDYRECVSCDFAEEMLFTQPSADLETRANRDLDRQAIKFVDASVKK
ncbi:MAG: YheV family putative metal-binding protein [Gammaproteobacteria bacterium]|nr:YheV family putative metal-binding protein [Gammaproteobacteria bacterium]MBQ0839073.1 YheV family putative metal-binding protein [Gammaproteobacteria bacterium]